MSELRFVAADVVPQETVWRAFVEGFKGYVRPFEIAFDPFMAMMEAEDVDFGASVVALDAAGEPGGVALLATRDGTCWCGGLGVVPALRQQGLGRRLMEALIDGARVRGFPRMRLECIDGNDAARALYDGLGYRALRRLDVFEGFPSAPRFPEQRHGSSLEFGDPETVWIDFDAYHPVQPTWQNQLRGRRADAAAGGPIVGLALGRRHRPRSYVLARVRADERAPIVILDAGARPEAADPTDDLAELVVRLLAEYPERPLVAVNVPEDAPLNAALRRLAVPVPLTQTEMELTLAES
jgi:GNAT superfamily N-acetyltransferase